jgi:cytoskeletal protein RodZ
MGANNSEKSIGRILRDARTEKNISLEQASKNTKIHLNILKVLESEDIETLGTVYAKSFLKLYAEYLGVDKEAILRRFQEAASQEETKALRRVRFPGEAPPPKGGRFHLTGFLKSAGKFFKGINYKIVIVLIVALAVIAGVVKFVKHRQLTTPTSEKAESKILPSLKPVSKKPLMSSKALPEKTIFPEAVKSVEVKKAVLAKEMDTAVAKAQEKIVLVVKAKDKSWLSVKVDGKTVFRSILAKGTAESWQAREKIELTVGNAGAVELELNGKLLGKIGRPGQTLKNVVVTKAGLSIQK